MTENVGRQPPDDVIARAWKPHAEEMERAFDDEELRGERVWSGIVDRSGWERGAWDDEPDGIVWRAGAPPHYRCQIVRNPFLGSLAGYVALPAGHPAYGKPHSELGEIEVWGGITFSETQRAHWVVGFHCSGRKDVWPARAAFFRELPAPDFKGVDASPETIELMKSYFRVEYKTVTFVRAECESLAAQLARLAAGAQP